MTFFRPNRGSLCVAIGGVCETPVTVGSAPRNGMVRSSYPQIDANSREFALMYALRRANVQVADNAQQQAAKRTRNERIDCRGKDRAVATP
jgi:hypothetical protein